MADLRVQAGQRRWTGLEVDCEARRNTGPGVPRTVQGEKGGAGIGSAPGPGLNDCVPLRHFVSATALRDQVFISISQAGHCSAEKLEGWGLWEESERPLEV